MTSASSSTIHPASAPPAKAETMALVRENVRELLQSSPAFQALPADKRQQIAHDTVKIAAYLAQPDGIKANKLAALQATPTAKAQKPADPYAFGLSGLFDIGGSSAAPPTETATTDAQRKAVRDIGKSKFSAQAAREGAEVAGLFLKQVNFPEFVGGLITNVFHAIVTSSIEQMEAYGNLVKSVAQTLNQFRDENTTDNQGRDHLIDQFPDTFKLSVESGDDGAPTPRVKLRDGADEQVALQKVNSLPIEGGPVNNLDDDTIEGKLVPAARTQLATGRQQLLATMVLMGINRIVVTDGRISAKVLYDFQARDNRKFQRSAAAYDYSDKTSTVTEGEYDNRLEGGSESSDRSRDKDQSSSSAERTDASFYSKGKYKTTEQPILKAMSAASEATDTALQVKASLAGSVDVNFKSDYFPLEKMADSFQIAQLQNAAKPGAVRAAPGAAAAAGAPPPAAQQPAAAPAGK